MSSQVLMWVGVNIFLLGMIILDLKVFHRRAHVISIKESLLWTAFWITLSLLFNLIVYFWRGPDTALEFLTAYLIEKSLSVDNLFVFLLIFTYFAVPSLYQHRVLLWGILGAIVLRLAFILTGITLIETFHWVLYVFGSILILSAIRMAFQKDKKVNPEKNPVLRIFRRFMPVTDDYQGDKFFVKRAGRYFATPLVVVVLVVETTDVVFAVDSIPAALSITLDPFIVYTSNIFAILGLRALYFALAGVMRLYHYLHYGLIAVLVFVGAKMLLSDFYEMPVGIALGVVSGVLLFSVIASIVRPLQVEVASVPSELSGEEAEHDHAEQHYKEP